VIFFLMLAGIAASLVSSLVSKHSLYEYLKFQYILKLRKEGAVMNAPNEQYADANPAR